jgi:multidrug efflux pump subunit AcrA (membrane-fusion protein)
MAYKNNAFDGTIDWVSDVLDPSTRTARVRVVLDNSKRMLKPEMYVAVDIGVDRRKALAIPRKSVLALGEHRVVFVEVSTTADDRTFERVPVDVDEGGTGDWVTVGHGLESGQNVVVSGADALSQKL